MTWWNPELALDRADLLAQDDPDLGGRAGKERLVEEQTWGSMASARASATRCWLAADSCTESGRPPPRDG